MKRRILDWLFTHNLRTGYIVEARDAFYLHIPPWCSLTPEAVEFLDSSQYLWRRGGSWAGTMLACFVEFSRKEDAAMFMLTYNGKYVER